MKILYVTTISNTINAFLIPHIKFLIKEGNHVDIACNIVREINPDLLKLGCKIHNIEFQRSPINIKNYIAYKKIKKLVLLEGYKIVHTHTPVASFLTRLACRKFSDVKVLYTTHGFHFYKGAPLKNWIIYYTVEKISARWTDGIITINHEDFNIAQKFHIKKEGNVHLIPGIGVNLYNFKMLTKKGKNFLRELYGFKNNDFLLIYTAEFNKNKNQIFLIRVVSFLRDRYPNIKLLLVGDGNLKEKCNKFVNSLNLQKNVIFSSNRKDLDKLISICDVGVSSSLREGLGLNLIECMAYGLPVVANDNRGHRESIKDGKNGFIVSANDINKFASCILALYKNKSLRDEMGRKGIELAKTYSIDIVMKEMQSIYLKYM